LNYETELIGLEQTSDRVLATVVAGGETRQIEASYVIGADGGASTVRSLTGITMSGNALLTYTTNAIIRSRTLKNVHDKGDAYRFIFIGPEGTWATIVAIDGRDRYRFSLIGSTTKTTYSKREIRDAVVKALPGHTVAPELPADEAKRWRSILAPITEEWVKQTPDGAKILAAHRAEMAKLAAAQ